MSQRSQRDSTLLETRSPFIVNRTMAALGILELNAGGGRIGKVDLRLSLITLEDLFAKKHKPIRSGSGVSV
jgi:hypothetical protein